MPRAKGHSGCCVGASVYILVPQMEVTVRHQASDIIKGASSALLRCDARCWHALAGVLHGIADAASIWMPSLVMRSSECGGCRPHVQVLFGGGTRGEQCTSEWP